MASPQPTDSHTRISNELYNQILMRDFTKRQRAILDLLLRLSYGCGKKTAYIPQMRHFEACGVAPNKVKRELNSLRLYNVVGWNSGSHEFWLNKDYDTWQIDSPSDDQKDTFAELLRINLKAIDAQNGRRSDQNGHDQNGQDDQKGQPEPPKMGGENGPKRSSEEAEIPCGPRPPEPPITIDNYKDIKNREREIARAEIVKAYEQVIGPLKEDGSRVELILEYLERGLEVPLVVDALKKSQNAYAPFKYALKVLYSYDKRGIQTLEQAMQENTSGGGYDASFTFHSRAAPTESARDKPITKGRVGKLL